MKQTDTRLYPVERTILQDFVRRSLNISGIRKKGNGNYKEIFDRYLEICTFQLNNERLEDPFILHHGLLNDLSLYPGQYRTGIAASDHDVTPKAEYAEKLCRKWYKRVNKTIAKSGSLSEFERERIALELFFDFLSIRPFKEANGRTGRLLHNCIRVRMGLPWVAWRYSDFEKIIPQYRAYQQTTFVPKNRKYL